MGRYQMTSIAATPAGVFSVTEAAAIARPRSRPLSPEYLKIRESLDKVLTEAATELYGNCVDMSEPFMGCGADGKPNGEYWAACGTGEHKGTASVIRTESKLTSVRCSARVLAERNEFAICGHENRVNYIVGTGHKYTVTAKPELKEKVSDDTIADVQVVIDAFTKDNKWARRQQEIQKRKDRDGECFQWLFEVTTGDGEIATKALRIRFVEPGQVTTPPGRTAANETFGIVTEKNDVETITAYWIDGELVAADEIQHRKENVDLNVKRGLPLFYPVEKNLRRAEKLLRNMTTVASIQSAIALIRKHSGAASEEASTNFVQDHANYAIQHGSQPTTYHERFAAGTVLDAPHATEYDFPTAAIDASQYVVVLQAELRAVACRLNMPEFMLTADASNANYSSTMVAEGPAVKSFERLQATMIEEDLEIFDRVLDLAVEGGMITQEQRDQVDIDVTPPTIQTRNRLEETQADQILVNGEAMSVPTWQERNELDPEHETALIDEQREKNLANMEPFGTMVPRGEQQPTSGQERGDDDEDDDDEDEED